MYWLLSLLAVALGVDGLLCGGAVHRVAALRKLVCVMTALALLIANVGLTVIKPEVWMWGLPLAAYQLLNLLRVYKNRLPYQQLRTTAVRAFGWLLVAQTITVLAAMLITTVHAETTALDVLVVAQLLSSVILLRATTHTWQHARFTTDVPSLADKSMPSVSVLVPARNETEDLMHCLELLASSDYPKLEILVLDDCSASRHTPDIIRSFAHVGVRFVQGTPPDETNWLAKNHAYAQLAAAASGDILLFCGVDTRLEPQAVRLLVEQMEARGSDMLSTLPLRTNRAGAKSSTLLQSMRYYWEICLPRSFFKRPPVLSTCWLLRRQALSQYGGFESVRRSVSPEATFARQAVTTNAYSFVRSDELLGVLSDKLAAEQYNTSVRVRYPQLHRRLELVALVSIFELVFLIGPVLGLLLLGTIAHHTMAYAAIWSVTLSCLLTTYGLMAVGARLVSPWFGWLLMPLAFLLDLAIVHISLWKYEFSEVTWKGRNVCIPVMQVRPQAALETFTTPK